MVLAVQTQVLLEFVEHVIAIDPRADNSVRDLVGGLLENIIDRMANACLFFSLIYLREYIVGSYRDNIKINMPDEYDFNILLMFPKAKVEDDPEEMGTVKINMNAYKDKIGEFFLKKCVNYDGFLKLTCLQSYIESLLERIKISKNPVLISKYYLYIKIVKSGPAHTLHVEAFENKKFKYKFDIDFVPGIVFNYMQGDELIAIPKPNRGGGNAEKIHFIPAFPQQESELLKDKQNLKAVLRLIKKIRDHNSITNLKSYYIKTAFLWVDKEKGASYWNKAPDILLEEMLRKILQYLEERNLPFFWRPKHNMLKKLKTSQIDEMRAKMFSIVKKYKKSLNTSNLLELFLTEEEICAHHSYFIAMTKKGELEYCDGETDELIEQKRRSADGYFRRRRDEF